MELRESTAGDEGRNSPAFSTTLWGVVVDASTEDPARAREALEQLCRRYWRPLYAYARRKGRSAEDAEDLTQQFFARFLELGHVRLADPERGRFRTFLLTCFQRFLTNEWEKSRAVKRGGNSLFVVPRGSDLPDPILDGPAGDEGSPEDAYDRRWALTLLGKCLEALRAEYAAAKRSELFDALKEFVWGSGEPAVLKAVRDRFGMNEGAARVAVHRLRRRFGEMLRGEVVQTVARPEDVDDELRHLLRMVGEARDQQ